MGFVKALNEIHSNIWAMFIIAGGVILCRCGDSSSGSALILLGAGVFKQSVGATEQVNK